MSFSGWCLSCSKCFDWATSVKEAGGQVLVGTTDVIVIIDAEPIGNAVLKSTTALSAASPNAAFK